MYLKTIFLICWKKTRLVLIHFLVAAILNLGFSLIFCVSIPYEEAIPSSEINGRWTFFYLPNVAALIKVHDLTWPFADQWESPSLINIDMYEGVHPWWQNIFPPPVFINKNTFFCFNSAYIAFRWFSAIVSNFNVINIPVSNAMLYSFQTGLIAKLYNWFCLYITFLKFQNDFNSLCTFVFHVTFCNYCSEFILQNLVNRTLINQSSVMHMDGWNKNSSISPVIF